MNLSPLQMTIIGSVASGLGFFVAGAASLPPEQQVPPLLILLLGSIGAMLSFMLGYTNKGTGTKATGLVLGLMLFGAAAEAQTSTPTRTPTITPTRTNTPQPGVVCSHVTCLEMDLLNAEAPPPSIPTPIGNAPARCVQWFQLVSGVPQLRFRCAGYGPITVPTP